MPHLDPLPGWARRLSRGFLVAAYLALAAVGGLGLTWPPGGYLADWAHLTTRISGGTLLASSLIAAVAALKHWWLLELDIIWIIGAGLTGYAAVLLGWIGPTRWALITLGMTIVIASGLAGRGVVLTAKVSERLRARWAATGRRA